MPSTLIATIITLTLTLTPAVTVTGEPTPTETTAIEQQWERFVQAFPRHHHCLGGVEVQVVDRVEDYYSFGDVGPIAAFYQPSTGIVFIEHRKVVPRNLIHEYAHHLDVSCGLYASPFAQQFMWAVGLSGDWWSGSSWRTVPAEVFAEAVVTWFGEKTRIDVPYGGVVVAGLVGLRWWSQ